MSEQPQDQQQPDVFEAYARLRLAVIGAPESDNPVVGRVTVDVDDFRTVLDVPLAHALTDAAIRRGVRAAGAVYPRSYGRISPDEREIRAALIAALGGGS